MGGTEVIMSTLCWLSYDNINFTLSIWGLLYTAGQRAAVTVILCVFWYLLGLTKLKGFTIFGYDFRLRPSSWMQVIFIAQVPLTASLCHIYILLSESSVALGIVYLIGVLCIYIILVCKIHTILIDSYLLHS